MRWLWGPLLALYCLTGAATRGWSADPEIWFNPHVPVDWLQMWSDDAPWQTAAGHVNTIEIVHWWLDTATDAQINAIGDFAKRHHMKVDLEIQGVGRYPTDSCGTTEGYSTIGILTAEAAILKRHNITADFITMDEPVGFGHYNKDSGSCSWSVSELATRVAANINGAIALFPNAQLYEIETVPGTTDFPDWREVVMDFQNQLRKLTGKSIRGIQLDVGWSTPSWEQGIRDMRDFTHQRNLKLGVIADPPSKARTDVDAVAATVDQIEYLEGTLGIVPDQWIFTTWGAYPTHNMPETSPAAQTWGIDRYFRRRTLMTAHFSGLGVQGKLTGADGQPIAGATINGYVPGVDFTKPLPLTVVQDVVPAAARSALMGIRLNTECGCQGINDILVGSLRYQETSGGSSTFSFLFPPVPGKFNGANVDGEWVGGTKVTRFITTTPTQTVYPNSGIFPVTPGAHYSFTVPASTIGGVGWFGNAFLLWLDARGNGITREIVIPPADRRLMSSTVTAADGTFTLPKLPRVGPGARPVSVEYPGDDNHRAVAWTPLR